MTSYCATLWQIRIRNIGVPYVGISFSAYTREQAVAKGREWARMQDQLPQTRLQITAKGLTIHREIYGEFVF